MSMSSWLYFDILMILENIIIEFNVFISLETMAPCFLNLDIFGAVKGGIFDNMYHL